MRLSGQLILYESTNVAELHVASQTSTSGRYTTQGIENATGTVAAFVPGRVQALYSLTSDAVRFATPDSPISR